MKPNHFNFGLVLTGGGAKGAYQAGALQYLAELRLQPQIIAGTSIGALNGAVLASSGSFPEAVRRLNELWDNLGKASILQAGLLKNQNAIFDPEPIEKLLKQTVDFSRLINGIELWITLFPSLKIPGLSYSWLIDLVRAKTGTDARWLCAQDCSDEKTLYNLLLASAAIPLAFPQREVNGQFYVDGGLADNVPLRALAARGCTHAIIIHLGNGAIWNRHDFPQQIVIEIRPEKPINKLHVPILDLIDTYFDFSAGRIADLKQRGYDDAKCCLEPIIETFLTVKEQRQIQMSLVKSTQLLLDDAPL